MRFCSPTICATSFAVPLRPCSSTSAIAILSPILHAVGVPVRLQRPVLILYSLCELDGGRAPDAAGGTGDDGDAAFVDDWVHFVVHGRDGVV